MCRNVRAVGFVSMGLGVAISLAVFSQGCSKDSSDPAGDPTVTLGGASGATTLALAQGTIDAAVMKVKVFKFAASESADCSSPVEIFSNAAGVEKDLLSNPTFGAGTLKAGTYPCVMIEVSKIITTAAATTSDACVKDVAFSDVICQQDQTSKLIDGTAVTCDASITSEQHVTLFLNTLSAGNTGVRALEKPTSTTDTTSGLVLTSAMVVSGDKAVKLKVDPTKFMQPYSQGGESGCGTSAPKFSFE